MKYIFYFLFLVCTISVQAIPETITNKIHVDQFGYQPQSRKVAVISNPVNGYNADESFLAGSSYEIRDWYTDAVVFSGNSIDWSDGTTHAQSGDQVWWFDFSSFQVEGSYYVYDVENDAASVRFEIDSCVYVNVLKAAVRAFYYQRCGMAKPEANAGTGWTDGVCHHGNLQDTQCRLYNDLTIATEKDLSGGWHDAGDFNKYVNFCFDPVLDLLDGVDNVPSLSADNFNIPESGNGIPDLLDEVKYELDWLLKMQQEDGSVLSIVGKMDYDGSSPPSTDEGQRVYGPATTSASYAAAAMFARASKLFFEENMDDYATTLQEAAIDAWTWAENNPGIYFYNTGVIVSGEQETDVYGTLVRRLCAAIFLYDLTNGADYLSYAESNYDEAHLMQWQYAYPFEHTIQHALIHFSLIPGVDEGIAADIRDVFSNSMSSGNSDNLEAFTSGTDAYRAYLADQNYTWGSNTTKARQGIMFLSMYDNGWDADNTASYYQAAEAMLQNFHGVNPNHKVYLTNMSGLGGENSCNTIYHGWFTDGNALWDEVGVSTYGPPPGFVPGGVNPSYDLDGCCPNGCGAPEFNALCASSSVTPPLNQPVQKSYRDWNAGWPQNSWTVTEIGIYTQAAYVRLLSAFVEEGCELVIGVQEEDASKSELVLYPNPASEQLFISWKGITGQLQNISVTDMSGREVINEKNPRSNGNASFYLDISLLEAGMYCVNVATENGIVSARFVRK